MSDIRVVNVRGLNRPEQRAGIVYVGRPFAGWPGHRLANPFKLRKDTRHACTKCNWRGLLPVFARQFAPSSDAYDCPECGVATAMIDTRAECLDRYRAWLLARPTLDADLAALWEETDHGAKPLGCWCVTATAGDGQPVCHAQILAELLRERFVVAGGA